MTDIYKQEISIGCTINNEGSLCNADLTMQPPLGHDLGRAAANLLAPELHDRLDPSGRNLGVIYLSASESISAVGLHEGSDCSKIYREQIGVDNHDEYLSTQAVGALATVLKNMGLKVKKTK